MTFTITKEVILFALAIYGAVLSTWNLVKAIRKDRRALAVTVGSKIPVGMGGQLDRTIFAHLEVTNIGQRSVTITTMAFQLRDGRRLLNFRSLNVPGLEDTALPITLADGQSAQMHQAYSDIGEALFRHHGKHATYRVWPICEDSTRRTHKGKAWDVDTREFKAM